MCIRDRAMIVVSEIGEQWSPHTAPAIHAAMHTMPMGASRGKIAMVMGMSNVSYTHLDVYKRQPRISRDECPTSSS